MKRDPACKCAARALVLLFLCSLLPCASCCCTVAWPTARLCSSRSKALLSEHAKRMHGSWKKLQWGCKQLQCCCSYVTHQMVLAGAVGRPEGTASDPGWLLLRRSCPVQAARTSKLLSSASWLPDCSVRSSKLQSASVFRKSTGSGCWHSAADDPLSQLRAAQRCHDSGNRSLRKF